MTLNLTYRMATAVLPVFSSRDWRPLSESSSQDWQNALYRLAGNMKNFMLFSTNTGAGKHTIACGILRSLRRQGINVTPFKAVSIESHACRLPDGAEISFAHAIQAMAAGKRPCAEMNPYVALY